MDSNRACCNCNNIAHGISSSYHMEDLFSQSLGKIWKLHMKPYSYQRANYVRRDGYPLSQRIPISSNVICVRLCKEEFVKRRRK